MSNERDIYETIVSSAIDSLTGIEQGVSFEPKLEEATLDGNEQGYRPTTDGEALNAWITKGRPAAPNNPTVDLVATALDSVLVGVAVKWEQERTASQSGTTSLLEAVIHQQVSQLIRYFFPDCSSIS